MYKIKCIRNTPSKTILLWCKHNLLSRLITWSGLIRKEIKFLTEQPTSGTSSVLFTSWQENFAKDMICIKRIGLAAWDWWYTTLSTCEGVMWRVLAKNDQYNCLKPDVTTCIYSSVKQNLLSRFDSNLLPVSPNPHIMGAPLG